MTHETLNYLLPTLIRMKFHQLKIKEILLKCKTQIKLHPNSLDLVYIAAAISCLVYVNLARDRSFVYKISATSGILCALVLVSCCYLFPTCFSACPYSGPCEGKKQEIWPLFFALSIRDIAVLTVAFRACTNTIT